MYIYNKYNNIIYTLYMAVYLLFCVIVLSLYKDQQSISSEYNNRHNQICKQIYNTKELARTAVYLYFY